MGIIKKLFGGSEERKEFKQKLKQATEDDRIATMVEERKLSSNERDLLKRYKQKHEEDVKKQLDVLRKKDNEEMWKSKNSILSGGKSILKEDRPILKEKNIFKDNPNLFTKEHSLHNHTDMGFFK